MTSDRASDSFIGQLPKAELHLHIEGTLEPQMMLDLAARNDVTLPYKTADDVTRAYEFENLQDFLDLYYAGMSVLMQERDFHDLTWAYLQKAAADGVRHAEIFFDPQGHTDRGVNFETALDGIWGALEAGRRELGISSKLIMCFLRHLSEDSAFETLVAAKRHKDRIFGVGLDSSELGHPPEKFARVFAEARAAGFTAVAHAGEEGPIDYVKGALDILKVARIDHGNRALDDADLVARLVRERIPLTMCPLSNLRLKVIPTLAESPVKRALDAGLLVTINSDDPAYFGGYINANYRGIEEALGLGRAELTTLANNSFTGSFLGESEKQVHLDRIAQYAAAQT